MSIALSLGILEEVRQLKEAIADLRYSLADIRAELKEAKKDIHILKMATRRLERRQTAEDAE